MVLEVISTITIDRIAMTIIVEVDFEVVDEVVSIVEFVVVLVMIHHGFILVVIIELMVTNNI